MVIDHNNKAYRRKWGLAKEEPERALSEYFSKIIPKVKTDRDWVTVNIGQATDGAIIIIHDPDKCGYLSKYDDLVLICADESAAEKMHAYGHTVTINPKGSSSSVKKTIQNTLDKIDSPAE